MVQRDPYIGKQIGNYCIRETIASGSFGTVYLAQHFHLKQRVVVVKILHAVHLGSAEDRDQFLREAEILEMLRGLTNILPLLDVGIDGNVPYIIAEYAKQGSLRMHMRKHGGALPLQEALTIIKQVGQGLQCAHDQGIVHRDLKPENILFSVKGEALLADFGISTVLSTGSIKYTQVVGTPTYMAPEQFRGEVCKESDQYALACVAYELLTGHKVFNAPDFLSMGYCHVHEAPTPPRQLNSLIPVAVEYALLKALSKQRTERYPGVSTFVTALDNQSPVKDAKPAQTLSPSAISAGSSPLSLLPPQNHPTEETLRKAYEAVQYGKVVDPQAIRSLAMTFEVAARDPDASKKIRFNRERAAADLYKQAEYLEKIYSALTGFN